MSLIIVNNCYPSHVNHYRICKHCEYRTQKGYKCRRLIGSNNQNMCTWHYNSIYSKNSEFDGQILLTIFLCLFLFPYYPLYLLFRKSHK